MYEISSVFIIKFGRRREIHFELLKLSLGEREKRRKKTAKGVTPSFDRFMLEVLKVKCQLRLPQVKTCKHNISGRES